MGACPASDQCKNFYIAQYFPFGSCTNLSPGLVQYEYTIMSSDNKGIRNMDKTTNCKECARVDFDYVTLVRQVHGKTVFAK